MDIIDGNVLLCWMFICNVLLQVLNIFYVQVNVEQLLELYDVVLLLDVLVLFEVVNGLLLVLGSGSNVLIVEDLFGIVLVFGNCDISFFEYCVDYVVICVGVGVLWYGLVMWLLQEGLFGLENLVLIFGIVGVVLIQNIGVYGVQVGEFIQVVEVWDCQ